MTTLTSIREGAWLARCLLTSEEQDRLREAALAKGMPQAAKDDRLRDCARTEVEDIELSERLWRRLEALVPNTVIVDDDGEEIGLPSSEPVLHGTWRACGVNPLFRIVRYEGNGKGHFGPHRDGAFEKSLTERSLLTINGYLNDLPEDAGGCTRFVDGSLGIHTDDRGRFITPPSAVTHAVRPEAGCAVVFFHGLMHDGEQLALGAPPKWLFRSEVMYRREARDVDALATEDVEARRLDVLAESIERSNAMAAMELNKLSDKLRGRRISAQTAAQRAALVVWALEHDDEELMEDLQEELTNAHAAHAEQLGEEEAVESPKGLAVALGVPKVLEVGEEPDAERIHTCRRCSEVLLKAHFVGCSVGSMDAALARHTSGACCTA